MDIDDVLDPLDGRHVSLILSHAADPNDFQYYLDDSRIGSPCNTWWIGGVYDCPYVHFYQTIPPHSDTIWAVATLWEEVSQPGHHQGLVMVDATCTNENTFDANLVQPVRCLGVTAVIGDTNGNTIVDPGDEPVGLDLRFEGIAEYGRPVNLCDTGSPLSGKPTCEQDGLLPLERAVAGYNIYRLPGPRRGGPDPAATTPITYLYGTDEMPGTGDEGWVAFVRYYLDVDPDTITDLDPSDAFGIGSIGYGSGNPLEDTILLTFSDTPDLASSDPLDAVEEYSYAFQPVIQGTAHMDADGDTIADLDIDGDTTPEFISPQGSDGLGLTAYDDQQRALILLSTDCPTGALVRAPIGWPLHLRDRTLGGASDLDRMERLRAR
jgi:hypothetical protein